MAGLPKRKPSGPPEGYFDQLPDKLMAKLKGMEEEGGPAVSDEVETPVLKAGWAIPGRVWAVAAGVLVLLVASFVLVRLFRDANKDSRMETMAWETGLESVESLEIIQVLATADLSDEDLYAALGQEVELGEGLDMKGDSEEMIELLEHEYLDDLDLEGLDLNDVELL